MRVELLASASPGQFAGAIGALAADGAVDAIVVLYVPPLVTGPEAIAAAVRDAAEAAPVPVVAVFAMSDAPAPVRGLPCFRFPEGAARALGRAARYGAWRAAPAGEAHAADRPRRPRRAARAAHVPAAGRLPRRAKV